MDLAKWDTTGDRASVAKWVSFARVVADQGFPRQVGANFQGTGANFQGTGTNFQGTGTNFQGTGTNFQGGGANLLFI